MVLFSCAISRDLQIFRIEQLSQASHPTVFQRRDIAGIPQCEIIWTEIVFPLIQHFSTTRQMIRHNPEALKVPPYEHIITRHLVVGRCERQIERFRGNYLAQSVAILLKPT